MVKQEIICRAGRLLLIMKTSEYAYSRWHAKQPKQSAEQAGLRLLAKASRNILFL
jgi:hypothetical protein